MSDKVITNPVISLSANFYISAYGGTLLRQKSITPFADMVFFKIYCSTQRFIISNDALKALNAAEKRHEFYERYAHSDDIAGAFLDLKAADRGKLLKDKSIGEVIWGPVNICCLTSASGDSIYIPAEFNTLRNAMILGLNGAHIDIDVNEQDLTSTIRTYKPMQAAPKRAFQMK
jgi:hypothetical protein